MELSGCYLAHQFRSRCSHHEFLESSPPWPAKRLSASLSISNHWSTIWTSSHGDNHRRVLSPASFNIRYSLPISDALLDVADTSN